MKFHRGFAWCQVLAGATGVIACLTAFVLRGDKVDRCLGDMEVVASDAAGQAAIVDRMLKEWSGQLQMAAVTAESHSRSLEQLQVLRLSAVQSTDAWKQNLQGFAQVSEDASRICNKFASQLPIRVPMVDVQTKEFDFTIPQVRIEEKEFEIPYPTANVGSRDVTVDLGLTDVSFKVPTLRVGRKNMTASIPGAVETKPLRKSVMVPSDVEVQYRELMGEEKALLSTTSTQLQGVAKTLRENQVVLSQVQSLLQNELRNTLAASEASLEELHRSLTSSTENEIPAIRERLQSQTLRIEDSKVSLQAVRDLVPWAFLLAAMIPSAILLQGLWNLTQTKASSLDDQS